MEIRRAAYSTLDERFNFLLDRSLSSFEIISKAKALIEEYLSDLEEAFTDEFLLLSRIYAGKKSLTEMIWVQIQDKVVKTFQM